jgi:superfamily I DNA/RNA helicase
MRHTQTLETLKDYASTTNKDFLFNLLNILEKEIEISLITAQQQAISNFKNAIENEGTK